MLPLDAALAALLQRLRPVAPAELALADALGCVAAEMPPLPLLPSRDVAASDGWALRASDLVGASSYSPLPLAAPPVWVEAGDPMPDGCDCVRRRRFGRSIRPDLPGAGGGDPGAGRSSRRSAISPRQTFAPIAGRVVAPRDLLIARAARLQRLAVRRPRLRIVNIPAGERVTGELIAESARAAGADVVLIDAAGRDAASIAKALDASACDLLVTIGGSGVGRTDATASALAKCGEVLAHGIALQPGRTSAVGTIGDRSGHRVARRAGPGARGMVDAGAAGA